MKKVLALILVLALAIVCVAGCAPAPAAEEPAAEAPAAEEPAAEEPAAEEPAAEEPAAEKMSFAFNCTTTDNEYFSDVASGVQQFCDENGIDFMFEGCEFDAAKQLEQFENYIAKGVNAIICCPVDPASLADVIAQAQEQGIVVIGQAQGIETANGNSIVDDYDYGVNLATACCNWIDKYFADQETVEVALLTLDGVEQTKLRGDGMEATFKEHGGIEIVARQIAETAEQGATVTETILTANPNLQVICCVNDNAAIGAWQAVDASGKITDSFYIGGGDYTSAIVDYLADPACAIRCSVNILPVQSGIDCATMAYNILTGAGEGSTMYFTFEPTYQEGTM